MASFSRSDFWVFLWRNNLLRSGLLWRKEFRLRSSKFTRLMRKPLLGAGVVSFGAGFFSLMVGSGVSGAPLGVNRLAVDDSLGTGLPGRRFSRAKGTDDRVLADSDCCLGRKLNARNPASEFFETDEDSGADSSWIGCRSDTGATVVAKVGKTDDGEILRVLPGKTDERVPANLKPPGLLLPVNFWRVLEPKRNPGVL